jgi:hypothetical protein
MFLPGPKIPWANFLLAQTGKFPHCSRMKYRNLAIAAIFLSLGVSAMGLEISKSVHRVDGLSMATEQALKSKKGLFWVYSDAKLKPT